jgi:hypothetical protein
MKKFVVLYQTQEAAAGGSAADAIARATPEQMKAGMALWQAWREKCGDAIIDLGAPLGNTTTVQAGGAAPQPSPISGYSILQAGSRDDAVKLMQGHPHFHMPGATIQILEIIPMPGS